MSKRPDPVPTTRPRADDSEPRTEPATRAAWLDAVERGTFPVANDSAFPDGNQFTPLPCEALRQTSSRPDVPFFYYIAESWANIVSEHLYALERTGLITDDHLVLDIGCGVGRIARFLALDRRIHYVGFDVFRPAIDWCRSAFAPVTGERFRFVHVDGSSAFFNPDGTVSGSDCPFPVEDGTVDIALGAGIFTHLRRHDCVAYLEQTARKLQPNGRAIVSIKPPPPGTLNGFTGNEQSIKIASQLFEALVIGSGLRILDDLGLVFGQQILVLEKP